MGFKSSYNANHLAKVQHKLDILKGDPCVKDAFKGYHDRYGAFDPKRVRARQAGIQYATYRGWVIQDLLKVAERQAAIAFQLGKTDNLEQYMLECITRDALLNSMRRVAERLTWEGRYIVPRAYAEPLRKSKKNSE